LTREGRLRTDGRAIVLLGGPRSGLIEASYDSSRDHDTSGNANAV
jgi:hypothetical protein